MLANCCQQTSQKWKEKCDGIKFNKSILPLDKMDNITNRYSHKANHQMV